MGLPADHPVYGPTLVRFFTHRLSLFCVSPLSLRSGVAGVCFELRSGESLFLDGLCHVVSGILALVSAWYFVASLTRWYGLVVLLFWVCLLFCHTNGDDTKISPLALINPFHT